MLGLNIRWSRLGDWLLAARKWPFRGLLKALAAAAAAAGQVLSFKGRCRGRWTGSTLKNGKRCTLLGLLP